VRSVSPTAELALRFESVLTRLRTDLAELGPAGDVQVEALSYEDRPFSHVIKVRARHRDGGAAGTFFVKISKAKGEDALEKMRRRVTQDFASTRRIANAMKPYSDLGVVRPVACYPEQLAIVTEEAPGQTLGTYIENHAAWFPSRGRVSELQHVLMNVGRWIRTFQEIDGVTGDLNLADLREYVDVRLRRLVAERIWPAKRRQDVLRHLDLLALQVPQAELQEVVLHADFAPGNILVSKDRVTVLDLAMVQRGSRLHDLSRLFLQLDVFRAKPQFRAATVAALQSALLRGYDGTLTSSLPLFRFLSMLHRVNHSLTLSLSRERLPAALLNRSVLRIHRRWIDSELQQGLCAGKER
jgi:tRNA A-37 threonylcarbamoyl transferase component Bud32